MQIIQNISDMLRISEQFNKQGKSIGFVPTMGFLHAGHESLLGKSREDNQISILSIFVNPTQFNQASDFEAYPIDLEKDLSLANKHQVDYVFLPDKKEMYKDDYRYQVQENQHSLMLEGEHRLGHFTGVLTIVLKLLNIVKPQKLYLGKKDYQQYRLIQDMVSAFFMPIEVMGCKTIREKDGLAMSSRNSRLSSQERAVAPILYDIITKSETAQAAQEALIKHNFKVDYVKDLEMRRYAAVWLGQTRLIDNVELIGK